MHRKNLEKEIFEEYKIIPQAARKNDAPGEPEVVTYNDLFVHSGETNNSGDDNEAMDSGHAGGDNDNGQSWFKRDHYGVLDEATDKAAV